MPINVYKIFPEEHKICIVLEVSAITYVPVMFFENMTLVRVCKYIVNKLSIPLFILVGSNIIGSRKFEVRRS